METVFRGFFCLSASIFEETMCKRRVNLSGPPGVDLLKLGGPSVVDPVCVCWLWLWGRAAAVIHRCDWVKTFRPLATGNPLNPPMTSWPLSVDQTSQVKEITFSPQTIVCLCSGTELTLLLGPCGGLSL